MKTWARTWAALGAAAALAGPAARAADPLAARVVVVANRADPDSLRIARHYAAVRGVPPDNILAFDLPTAETISWPEFFATLWRPLQDELVRRRWIVAAPTPLTDEFGRRRYAIAGHRIAALVVCRGVPLRLAPDRALEEVEPAPPDLPQFRTNAGAVDSELSLLAAGDTSINGVVPNPLFENDDPTRAERARVIEVSRLDGPTADEAAALVDRAVAAEAAGLLGRGYVDLGGPYPDGNAWLRAAAARLAALGFVPAIGPGPATLPATARADAPVLYFGWHTPDLNGPFALPGFRFPPGAVVVHIHSYSAYTLRSPTAGWCGPLVARGVTATLGNVYEPYLQCVHRPDLFLRALARGWNLADAAYYALPVLSWQSIVIGDPLYRPFAVPFDEQWRRRDRLPAEYAGYAVLRRMALLEAAGRESEALQEGREALAAHPTLEVGVAVAARLEAAGQRPAAAQALAFAAEVAALRPDQWTLARDAAQQLQADGRADLAVQIYRRLLGIAAAPEELRGPWLVQARRAALAAGDRRQAAAWKEAIDRFVDQLLRERP